MRLSRLQKVTRYVKTNEIVSNNFIEITSFEAVHFVTFSSHIMQKLPAGHR